MSEKKIQVKLVGKNHDTAYLSFPGHTHQSGVVKKSIELMELIKDYKGPRIIIDLDVEGLIIGLEVLAQRSDEAS
jgi:hypothetical protein